MNNNTAKTEEQVECCANCEHLVDFPKGNKYGDIDHLCSIHGYFVHAIHKDCKKIRRFTPGGKELQCHFKRKPELQHKN